LKEDELNLSFIQSYRVAKHLLEKKTSSQTDISVSTGVATGYVNEVVHELSDLNIVKIGYGKTVLVDHAKLLEKMSFDRPYRKLVHAELRLPASTVGETEDMVASYCAMNNIEHAYTMYSALKHYYEYYITYPAIHVYVQDPEKMGEMEQGEGSVPVVVLKQDRPDIMEQSMMKDGHRICDKIQVVIDLYSSGVGRDAAIRFYRDAI
jgi:hypothetical protein